MTSEGRLLICAVASVLGHVAFARGLAHLPRRAELPPRRVVSVRVVAPPPPLPAPEPEAPKPAEPVAPPPVVHERPRARPISAPSRDVHPRDTPPPEHPPLAGEATTTTPIFGVTMESTSQAGSGPAMPIGNSARPQAQRPVAGPAAVAALAQPVAAYEVTTMPLPQGRCIGKYTDEAKQAALEGTVVLDLVVGENGRARDIHVVSGLAHGLTQAAVEAVRECRFSPGEKNGTAVPVRLRGFKIRFLMQDND
ncbi:MAG TPA: energy transducer TonB [Polyangia bacterium]